MRILFLAPYTPLLTKPRPYNFILHLAQQHDIYLLCFQDMSTRDLQARPDYRRLQESCRYIEHLRLPKTQQLMSCAASLPTRLPLRVAYYHSRRMRQRVRELAREHRIDAIHVDRTRMARLAVDLPQPKILDLTDSISWYLKQCIRYAPLYLKPLYIMEYQKMRPYELTAGEGYDQYLLTSELDLTWYQEAAFYDRIHVIPNAIERTFFADEVSNGHTPSHQEDEDTLLFFGNMYYYPNVDAVLHFCDTIYPHVRREVGPIKLHIVGNKPARSVRTLQKYPFIKVMGYVPDLVQYIATSSVVVSPMRIGVGFPNKVAEALAVGKAIVATPPGQRGLAGSEDALYVAPDDDAFVEGIRLLIQDRAARHRMATAAWHYAREQLHPTKMLALLDEVYAHI